MLYLSKSFNQKDFDNFTKSERWGPSEINITNAQKQVDSIDYFNSWNFGISYVNNFVKSNADFVCGTDGDMDLLFAFVGGFDKTATTLTPSMWMQNNGLLADGEGFEKPAPFSILATSAWGQEVLKVTAYTKDQITVTRGSGAMTHVPATGSKKESIGKYFSETIDYSGSDYTNFMESIEDPPDAWKVRMCKSRGNYLLS